MVDRDLSRVSEGQRGDSTSGDQPAGVNQRDRRDAGHESCEAPRGSGTEARWLEGERTGPGDRVTGPTANPRLPDTEAGSYSRVGAVIIDGDHSVAQ